MSEPPKMGRPRKAGALAMTTDLRIPLTVEQKALLDDAAAGLPGGKAEWARTLLLRAAEKLVRGRRGKSGRGQSAK